MSGKDLLLLIPAVLSSALWARGGIKESKGDLVAAVALLLIALWLPLFVSGSMPPMGLNLIIFGITSALLTWRKNTGRMLSKSGQQAVAIVCIAMGLFMQILI